MGSKSLKSLLVAAFSVFLSAAFNTAIAQHETPQVSEAHAEAHGTEEKSALDPGKIIVEHVTDNHDWHFFDWNGHPVSLSLPVILYNKSTGKFEVFSSANFEHGHKVYNGYQLVNEHYTEHMKHEGLDLAKMGIMNQNIIAVDAEGKPNTEVKLYDFSMTKNVVQMLLGFILLIVILLNVAKKYAREGSGKAPSGFQNAIEPVIVFVRDDVAKPNLGNKYGKYLPLLLTIFFFILINNLLGLIPGSANVTGNIAFTAVLALVAFIVIMFSTNKHFWGHIFWYPGVPLPVKLIMLPVELMGVVIKPVALMIRLFANMLAGHVIILSFIILIFIFAAMNKALGYGTSPLFVGLSVFIYVIEVLVAFIQAYIFATLTAVFIGQAFEGEHAHEGDHGHAAH